jgi:hypothetical protein
MTNLIKLLEGRKSYIVAALMAVLVFLKQIGHLDEATYQMLQGLLIGGGIASLRSAIK